VTKPVEEVEETKTVVKTAAEMVAENQERLESVYGRHEQH
jgi:hypothetical protein